MKKQQKEIANIIQGLLDRDDVKGKKLLSHVLWLNTVTTKYKVGDLINANDYSLSIRGEHVVRWNMKIVKIVYHVPWEQSYHYECVCQVINKGVPEAHTLHVRERDIRGYAEDDTHVIAGKGSDVSEEIAVYI